jgi:hypothetical protein
MSANPAAILFAAVSCSSFLQHLHGCTFLHQFPAAVAHLSLLQLGLSFLALCEELLNLAGGLLVGLQVGRLEGLNLILLLLLHLIVCSLQSGVEGFFDGQQRLCL